MNIYDDLDMVIQEERASAFAEMMHQGQEDKIGVPYIVHLRTVARYYKERAEQQGYPLYDTAALTEEQREALWRYQCGALAAWLHDIVEDTPVIIGDLVRFGFPAYTCSMVNALTRKRKIAPRLYYGAIARDPILTMIKSADMDHNTTPHRLERIRDDATRERLVAKYTEGYRLLGTTSRWDG